MSPNPSKPSDSSRAAMPHRDSGAWWRRATFLVLAGGIIMGVALGVRHVQGLFLLPITLEKGWSRETFGFAMAIQNLTWGLAQPFAGMIADRFGSAKVIAGGLAFYAAGLLLMSQATTPYAFIWGAGVCIGVAMSGTAFGAVYGALSKLVAPANRGWALGLAGAIGGLGQFAMVPAAHFLLNAWGWVSTLLLLSVLVALLLPLAIPLKAQQLDLTGDEARLSMSEAIREAFAHRGFLLLNLGFLACGFQLAFIATHLPAYLLDKGMGASDAVGALATIALTNIFGTYFFGVIGVKLRRKYLLGGIYIVRTAAMALFILLPLSSVSVYVFSAVMGFVWLGTVPLTNGLLSQVFGVRYITTLFGFVFFGHQLGSFLGVWLGGYVFEATKSYDLIWLGAMTLGVLAAALHLPINDREVSRTLRVSAPA